MRANPPSKMSQKVILSKFIFWKRFVYILIIIPQRVVYALFIALTSKQQKQRLLRPAVISRWSPQDIFTLYLSITPWFIIQQFLIKSISA